VFQPSRLETEMNITVRTFALSIKKEHIDSPIKTNKTQLFQTMTQCFFIDRSLPTVNRKMSEGERAPSRGTPSGRSSAKKSLNVGSG